MSSLLWLSFLLIMPLVFAHASLTGPVANTKIGTIIGTFHNFTEFGRELTVERYFGIPYAEPPVGDLRFRKPVPKRPFTSTHQARKHGNACYQMHYLPLLPKGKTASEDCLFLNVYAPVRKNENLPVMIWIHGGGFNAGTSDIYVSDALAAYGNVIVVTFNYRLSLWGFLSTGDEHARGNYGLFDQHLAIKWVHENIKAFGGDQRRVTIFGESSGAVSVIHQSTFDGNSGLFQRAIAQSGSILDYWTFTKDPKHDAEKLGKLIGCSNMESEFLVECIKGATADTLNSVLNDVGNVFMKFPCPFIPNVDGELLGKSTEHLTKLEPGVSKSEKAPFFGTLDFLTGVNSAEGAFMMIPQAGIYDTEHLEPNRTYFVDELVPNALSFLFQKDVSQVIVYLVVHDYTDWADPENVPIIRNKFMQIFADFMFSIPMLEILDYHKFIAKQSKGTYLYKFDITPSQRFLPSPSWIEGASHADELEYLFFGKNAGIMTYMPLTDSYKPDDWETDIAEYMITMWSNFAKTGYSHLFS